MEVAVGEETSFAVEVDLPPAVQERLIYNWDFGDGEVLDGSKQAQVSHTYQEAGDYPVTVTIQLPGKQAGQAPLEIQFEALAMVEPTDISRVIMPTGLDILEYLSLNQLQSSFPLTWLQEIEPADVGALNLYVRLIADGLEADNLTVDISNLTAQESIEKALAMNQLSLQEGVDCIFVLEAVNKQETQTELVDVVVYDDGYT